MATGKLVPIPQVAAAQEIAGAVGKAGQVVSKPVFGRRKELDYELEIEREGQVVVAKVHEERRTEIPAWMAGLGGLLGLVGVGTAAAAVASGVTREDLKKKRVEMQAKRAEAKKNQQASFLGLGIFTNPFNKDKIKP